MSCGGSVWGEFPDMGNKLNADDKQILCDLAH
jgi:hypothetical protein